MYSFSIKLPGCKSSVQQIDKFCDQCLQLLNFSKHRKILFAIHEAVINAVAVHEQIFASAENNEDINVDIIANPKEIIVKVIDCGSGMSEEHFNDYTELAVTDQYNDRGRGLLFIEKFTDHLKFENLPNGKFCVTLHFLN